MLSGAAPTGCACEVCGSACGYRVVSPPSMISGCPVKKAASSDARNATAAATSAQVPILQLGRWRSGRGDALQGRSELNTSVPSEPDRHFVADFNDRLQSDTRSAGRWPLHKSASNRPLAEQKRKPWLNHRFADTHTWGGAVLRPAMPHVARCPPSGLARGTLHSRGCRALPSPARHTASSG